MPSLYTCSLCSRPTSKEFKSVRYWPGKPEDQVVELPVIDSMNTKPGMYKTKQRKRRQTSLEMYVLKTGKAHTNI